MPWNRQTARSALHHFSIENGTVYAKLIAGAGEFGIIAISREDDLRDYHHPYYNSRHWRENVRLL